MKAIKKTVLFFTISLFILSSCTLQKRHYMQGYHIDWKNSKHKVKQTEIAKAVISSSEKTEDVEAPAKINLPPSTNNELTTASNDNSVVLLPSKKVDLTKGARSLFEYQNEQNLKVSSSYSKVKPDEEKKRSGPGPIPGILLMLLGLVLFGLGYIFYTNLGVFIGTFFFLIFGIGGAIFFIIGIVMLFVR